MPSLSTFLRAVIPVFLAVFIYSFGLEDLTQKITDIGSLQWSQSTTHCYASIKTLASGVPKADCFSVSNGKFSSVHVDESSRDHRKIEQPRTGHVIPGLWDGHGHLVQYGELLDSVNLFGARSMQEVQERLLLYKDARPEAGTKERWLRGVGWDQARFNGQWPKSGDLEVDGFKDLYVMLDRVDVHCIWVSERVLSLLPRNVDDVPGGEIPERGVYCDNAMDLVLEHYPKPDKERNVDFVKNAMIELNKLGIVGMHDAGITPSQLRLYEELSAGEHWTVRVNAMIECEVRNTFCPEAVQKVITSNGMFHVRSVKLFGDGALGSWGSAMIDPYSDKPRSSGSLLVNATTLSKLTLDWARAGYQVNIHAIGDLANRNAINAFEAAMKTLCTSSDLRGCQARDHRFRIEHSQIVHPDDQRRMAELGIIPSIQPTHATSDMGYAELRLGKSRTSDEAYRMRSFLPLRPVLGSDFPVEPANVFEGMYAAITRRSPRTGLDPSGGKTGWYPEETISMEEAIKGFTINPAYGAFLEGKAGVIDVGAYADWVVLDEPLEARDIESLRTATVRETWVGGKRVYKRPLP